MDHTSLLIVLLRETASRLQDEATAYKWAHFGQCNCGHLAQTVTQLPAHLLQQAAQKQPGDWSEQALTWEQTYGPRKLSPAATALPDYGDRPALDEGAWEPEGMDHCTTTFVPMPLVFERLAQVGLSAADLVHLERLSDPKIRKRLGNNTQEFHYAVRDHLVQYLLAWADLLEKTPNSETGESAYSLAAE